MARCILFLFLFGLCSRDVDIYGAVYVLAQLLYRLTVDVYIEGSLLLCVRVGVGCAITSCLHNYAFRWILD